MSRRTSLRAALTALSLLAPLAAQSPLTTLFRLDSGTPTGECIYFDLDVRSPYGVRITGLDLALASPGNQTAPVEVWFCPNTRVGNLGNPNAWLLASTGTVTTAGVGHASPAAITPFQLGQGTFGICVRTVGKTQTVSAAATTFATHELQLTSGDVTAQLFGGATYSGVTVDCSIRYETNTQTLFASNAGQDNGIVYFDLQVVYGGGITIDALGLNLSPLPGGAGTVEIYTCPGTYVGHTQDPTPWTRVATGPAVAIGPGAISPVTVPPIALPTGNYGVAVRAIGMRQNFTGSVGTFSNPDLILAAGQVGSALFAGPTVPGMVNCRFRYQYGLVGSPTVIAPYGAGCGGQNTSFYEGFGGGVVCDLAGHAVTMVRTATGYQVTGAGTFRTPGANALVLPLGDDTVVATPTLTTPFPFNGGTTNALGVCSNGFVSASLGNGPAAHPDLSGMLNAPVTGWFCWRDLDPSNAGRVLFEQVGSLAIVTYDHVRDYQGASPSEDSTFQFQFDCLTGNVTLAVQQVSIGSWAMLVGYSPGGASADPGPSDLSTLAQSPLTLGTSDIPTLALAATGRALPQATLRFTTTGIAPAAVFGAVQIGFSQYPNGISLAPQMPGCFQYQNAVVTLPLFFGNAPSQVTPLVLPNLPGFEFYAQSVAVVPGINPLGAVVSNGLRVRIGDY